MKISVIIPVYNAERYVRYAIDSVLACAGRLADTDEVELLCVDDGSTDSSGRILDERSAQDGRIRVFHKSNGGEGSARNRGMDEATGDLLVFLDADDAFHPDALRVLRDVFLSTSAGIIRFGWVAVTEHGQSCPPLPDRPDYEIVDVRHASESTLRLCTLGAATAVSREVAQGLRVTDLKQGADLVFVMDGMLKAKKTVVVKMPLLHYLTHPDSVSHKISVGLIKGTCDYLPLVVERCAALGEGPEAWSDTRDYVCRLLLRRLPGAWRLFADPGEREPVRRAFWRTLEVILSRGDFFTDFAGSVLRLALHRESERLLRLVARMPSRMMFRPSVRYDFAFSLGAACLCTETLRAAGLQFASFPLDWTRGGGGIRERADLLVGGFRGWFEEKDFELIENPDAFGHDPYRNVATGMIFPHEFAKGVPLSESFPAVRAKIDRRVSRLDERLSSSRNVLAVWITDPQSADSPVSEDEVRYALARLSERYPSVRFELAVVDFAKGVPFESRDERRGTGYRMCAFDYRRYGDGEPVWSVRQEALVPLFAGLSVRDYRSSSEKRSHRAARRRRKYARYGAKTFWGYVWARLCGRRRGLW